MKKFENVLWGIILILIGLIVGGNALGLTNINIFFDGFWTLFIIIPCFIGLFTKDDKIGNIIGLLFGLSLLLASNDIIDFSLIWKLILPIILILIGLSIIFKNTLNSKVNKEIKKLNENKNKDNVCFAAFSKEEIKLDKEKFTGSNLNTIFGGIEYDLRNAIIDSDTVINANAIFGGIEIFVPENVKIKIKSTSVFGGVENKTNINEDKKSHTIYINTTSIFGGIEIKNKKIK